MLDDGLSKETLCHSVPVCDYSHSEFMIVRYKSITFILYFLILLDQSGPTDMNGVFWSQASWIRCWRSIATW